MYRYELLQMLARYVALFPEEQDVAERIAALVEARGDCFLRTCRPGHITGSAWVVSADRRRVALVHHRKLGRWLQPGGHADGQGDVAAVAWREAVEETGLPHLRLMPLGGAVLPLDIDVHPIPARYNDAGELLEGAHEHHDIRFLLVADDSRSDDALAASDESHAVGWFDEPALRTVTDEPSILRMLDKAAAWLD